MSGERWDGADEFADLFGAERARADVPDAVRDRVLQRVETTLNLPPSGGGGGGENGSANDAGASSGGSGATSATGSGSSAASATSGIGATSASATAGLARAAVLSHRAATGIAIGTFVAGIVTGVVLHSAFRPSRERTVTVERRVEVHLPTLVVDSGSADLSDLTRRAVDAGFALAPADAPPTAPTPTTGPTLPHLATTADANRGGAHVATGSPSDDTASRERALVEIARSALVRRNFAAALDAIERHARLAARGQLAEERESLRVQALAGAGRADEARAAAERFRQRYSTSLFRPVVEAAVRE